MQHIFFLSSSMCSLYFTSIKSFWLHLYVQRIGWWRIKHWLNILYIMEIRIKNEMTVTNHWCKWLNEKGFLIGCLINYDTISPSNNINHIRQKIFVFFFVHFVNRAQKSATATIHTQITYTYRHNRDIIYSFTFNEAMRWNRLWYFDRIHSFYSIAYLLIN